MVSNILAMSTFRRIEVFFRQYSSFTELYSTIIFMDVVALDDGSWIWLNQRWQDWSDVEVEYFSNEFAKTVN